MADVAGGMCSPYFCGENAQKNPLGNPLQKNAANILINKNPKHISAEWLSRRDIGAEGEGKLQILGAETPLPSSYFVP